MLKEALELIQKTAQTAQKPILMAELSKDGRKAYVALGGQILEYVQEPPNRNHIVHTLVDLILYARASASVDPVAWHGPAGVVLVIKDSDRRDFVMFPLTFSNRFLMLRELAEKKPAFKQLQFIRLLRVDLGLDNLAVVAQFRKLNFTMNDGGTNDFQHGRDLLGKEIIAKVKGSSELPDELPVLVPVYQQAGERTDFTVRCAIEIDTVNQMFQLLPLPDELERVVDLAQASIHGRLTAALGEIDGQSAIPVYYGEP